MKCWAGIKFARRNINSLRYADDTTLMTESKQELKSFLMKVKKENEKAVLKHDIQKTKIMASSPITSWRIEGEKVETVVDLWALKLLQMVTTIMVLKDTCSLKEKKYYQPRQHIKKRRHYFANKFLSSKATVFPVVMYVRVVL